MRITLIILALISFSFANCQQKMIEINNPDKFIKVVDKCTIFIDSIADCIYYKNLQRYIVLALKLNLDSSNGNDITFVFSGLTYKEHLPDSKNISFLETLKAKVFIISDNINFPPDEKVQQDTQVVSTFINKELLHLTPEIAATFGGYPFFDTFTIKENLFSKKQGFIRYKLIYPITDLQKKFWPIDLTMWCPNKNMDGGEEQAPWSICMKHRSIPKKEMDKIKEGIIKIKF